MKLIQSINPAWFLAGAAFFLPIKPAPVNLLLALGIVLALFSSSVRMRLAQLLKDPALILLSVLVFWLFLSALFPTSSTEQASDYVAKYIRLLFIPLLVAVFADDDERARVAWFFFCGVVISVFASYLVWFGMLEGKFNCYFKLRITHSFFVVMAIAWGVYWWLPRRRFLPPLMQWGLPLLLLAMVFNVVVVVHGLTGWVTAGVILGLWITRIWGVTKAALLGLALVVTAGAAIFQFPELGGRLIETWNEALLWFSGQVQQAQVTSAGLRLMYWSTSWQAFVQSPFWGYGLGGVSFAVQPFVEKVGAEVFDNPHNQYLLWALQGGLIALVLYFGAIARMWLRNGPVDDSPWVLRAILATYLVANLVNSFHFDFAESVFFMIAVGCFYKPLSGTDSNWQDNSINKQA